MVGRSRAAPDCRDHCDPAAEFRQSATGHRMRTYGVHALARYDRASTLGRNQPSAPRGLYRIFSISRAAERTDGISKMATSLLSKCRTTRILLALCLSIGASAHAEEPYGATTRD